MGARSDNFTRTDNPLSLGTPSDAGSAWVALVGTWGISSNLGYCVTGSNTFAYLESSISDVTVSATLNTIGGGLTGLCFRVVDANNGWFAYCGTTLIRLYKFVAGSFTQVGSDFTGAVASGDVITAVANGTSITIKQNGTTVLGPFTDSFESTATKHGLFGNGSAYFSAFSIAAFVAAEPTAVLDHATPTSMVFVGTSGSEGTAPYTYQWQESATASGTYVSVTGGSGGTTLTYTDNRSGLTRGTIYYRRLQVTDSLSSTFLTNNQAGSLWGNPISPGWIGDSQSASGNGHTTPPPDYFAQYIQWLGYSRKVTWTPFTSASPYGTNAAVGGTSDVDWESGSTDLTAAISTFSAANVTDVFIRLGTNGSSSASTFAANIGGAAAAILAGVSTCTTVWLLYPSAFMNFTGGSPADTTMAAVQLRAAALDALDNGSTIRVISRNSLRVFGDWQNSLLDGNGNPDLHLNALGSQVQAMLDALAYCQALGEIGGSSGIPLLDQAHRPQHQAMMAM